MMRILIIVLLVVIPLVRVETSIAATQVCKGKKEQITCANDSVIYVDDARYGRMKPGVCGMNPSFGFFNCSADVRQYLERSCAGRPSCLVELDSVLDRSNHGCPTDLSSYLDVSHHCLRVETPRIADSSKCVGKKYPVGMDTPEGYLARVTTIKTGIGSTTCPWSIEVRSGQTIRLRLYDFGIWQDPETTGHGPGSGTESHGARPACLIYATISEGSGSVAPKTICRGAPVHSRQVDRDRVVYTSNSNSVQVTVTTTNDPNLEQFLLKYEVVGCADPTPYPPRTSTERISDRLVIKCTNDDDDLGSEPKTWTLQCLDDGNWSLPLNQVNCSTSTSDRNNSPAGVAGSGILLTVAISAAVIVAVLVITCGLFVLYRRRVSKQEGESQVPLPAGEYYFVPSTGTTSDYGSWAPTAGGPYTPGAPVGPWAPGAQVGPWAPGIERRPSADCLERNYATTLQMRLNALPCSSSSPSFSSSNVPASAAGPYGMPYDPWTMMVYCPYHGTVTRVNGVEPGRARVRSEHNYEEVPLQLKLPTDGTDGEEIEDEDARNQQQQPLQHQHSGLYHELNF